MPGCSIVKHGFHLTKNVVFPIAYDGHFTYMHLVPSRDEKSLAKYA